MIRLSCQYSTCHPQYQDLPPAELLNHYLKEHSLLDHLSGLRAHVFHAGGHRCTTSAIRPIHQSSRPRGLGMTTLITVHLSTLMITSYCWRTSVSSMCLWKLHSFRHQLKGLPMIWAQLICSRKNHDTVSCNFFYCDFHVLRRQQWRPGVRDPPANGEDNASTSNNLPAPPQPRRAHEISSWVIQPG